MPITERHRKAVKLVSENLRNKKVLDKGEILRQSDYPQSTSESPSGVFRTKGFQEALEEAGLTDEFLNNALYSDIKHKPKNRKPELELAYKLKNKLMDKLDVSSAGKPIPILNAILSHVSNKEDSGINQEN